MPQLTPEQQDAISESISRQLYRINRVVRTMFGQELNDDEIRRGHQRISQGVNQALQQQQGRTATSAAPRSVNPADMVEGGFVNDTSGRATAAERQRLGIR